MVCREAREIDDDFLRIDFEGEGGRGVGSEREIIGGRRGIWIAVLTGTGTVSTVLKGPIGTGTVSTGTDVDSILEDRKAAFRSRSVSKAAERESGIIADTAVVEVEEVEWWFLEWWWWE